MPRDFCDVLLLFIIVPLQITPIFILPPVGLFLVARMFEEKAQASFILALVAFLVLYFVWITFSVWSLQLSEKGVEFVRLFGKPKFEITDISEVSRKEVITKGWLWPLFPCREMTACLSALRHFRIRWGENYCYFPPSDADNFLKLVSEFKNKKSV
jgi:energy-coupling factor transporter transmembrane protein EcfT